MGLCWNKTFFYVYPKVEVQAPCRQVLVYTTLSLPGIRAEHGTAQRASSSCYKSFPCKHLQFSHKYLLLSAVFPGKISAQERLLTELVLPWLFTFRLPQS